MRTIVAVALLAASATAGCVMAADEVAWTHACFADEATQAQQRALFSMVEERGGNVEQVASGDVDNPCYYFDRLSIDDCRDVEAYARNANYIERVDPCRMHGA